MSSDSSDEETEVQTSSLKCLFCDEIYPQPDLLFKHMSSVHQLTKDVLTKNSPNQYTWIRLVNLQRINKFSTVDDLMAVLKKNIDNEDCLKPHDATDELLWIDYEPISELESNPNYPHQEDLSLEDLKVKYDDLMEKFMKCKKLLKTSLDGGFTLKQTDNVLKPTASEDSAYFETYSHHSIHSTMINDFVRTNSYRKFIMENAENIFRDKVVLDVGTGSGILSIFAAKAGAKHVYAVEASSQMFSHAMETVVTNGLKNKITVIHGKMEEISLPVDSVDVIISEWMGYLLLYECMLDSVLYAARKYKGRIYPREYSIHMMPIKCSDKLRHDEVDMWLSNQYEISMPSMRREALTEAVVIDLKSNENYGVSSLTPKNSGKIVDIDLHSKELLKNDKPFDLDPIDAKYVIEVDKKMDGFLFYFDTQFDSNAKFPVHFSTGPNVESTHWKQVLVSLPDPIELKKGDCLKVNVHISRTEKYSRGLVIRLKYQVNDQPVLRHDCNFL